VTILGFRRDRYHRPGHTKLAQRAARDALDVVLVHTTPVILAIEEVPAFCASPVAASTSASNWGRLRGA
jgi:hypothetical protein